MERSIMIDLLLSKKKVVDEEPKDTSVKKRKRKYINLVKKYTRGVDRQSILGYDPEKLMTSTIVKEQGMGVLRTSELLVIDHKVSIDFGFKNNIPPDVIAHVSNLRFIPSRENNDKGTKCFIDEHNSWIEEKYMKI